ncbi:ABC transporter [Xylariaceae sp. FL0804]|nr:ABC transporter [Xylariaceae sp. FL0804]
MACAPLRRALFAQRGPGLDLLSLRTRATGCPAPTLPLAVAHALPRRQFRSHSSPLSSLFETPAAARILTGPSRLFPGAARRFHDTQTRTQTQTQTQISKQRSESERDEGHERNGDAALSSQDRKDALPQHEHSDASTRDVPSFAPTERAARAAQMNTRARLSKEGKDSKKFYSLWELWRLLKIARPELVPLLGAIMLLFVSSAVTMCIPKAIAKVMDYGTEARSTGTNPTIYGYSLSHFLLGVAAALTVGATANFGRIILLRIIGERVVARLRSQLYRKTFSQDAEFFDANRVGDLISRLGSDTVVVGKSITQNISDGLRSAIGGAAGFVMMITIAPNLLLNMVFVAPFIGAGTWIYTRIVRRLSRQMQNLLGDLSKVGEERLGNVKTSQAFVGEVQELRRYHGHVRSIFDLGKKTSWLDAWYFAGNAWMGNMIIVGMLWQGGTMVQQGLLTQGDLTSFMMYAVLAGSSIFGVTGFLSELTKGVGAAGRLFELQDREPTISATKGINVRSAQGTIRFNDVSFSYPTRPAVSIFNHMSFEVPKGSNVCIVGPSGGGKSTVTSLLLRFYDLTGGSITINGVDIAKMNAKALRKRIGIVPQEPVLFSGSIAENIKYSNPKATSAEVRRAAQRANCQFVQDQPAGFNTEVGPRGSQLSGGQKQRIALARAILKDPDILILDEATSALDAKSETAVNAALANLMEGHMTTISIAHRLSTIKRSDLIIVLHKEGYVAEIGTYRDLSSRPDSAFNKLMEQQMHGSDIPKPGESPETPGLSLEEEPDRYNEDEQHDDDAARRQR